MALVDNIPSLSTSLGFPVDSTRSGAFGRSLDGASAAGFLQKDRRIVSGMNMDGTFMGDLRANDSSVDVKRPVFPFGSETHIGGEDPNDIAWQTFPAISLGGIGWSR
jgi:hypothetical protein